MLKNALFSPTQPWRAVTRFSPRFVLVSLRPPPYRFHRRSSAYPLARDRSERLKRYVFLWAFVQPWPHGSSWNSIAKQAVGRVGAEESPRPGERE